MKRVLLALVLGVAAVAAAPIYASTPTPPPTGYVNDFAHVMGDEAEAALEEQLVAFNASTTNELAVVTINSLQGDYIEHYAEQLFQEWGIGTETNDNGVLLLLAVDDRELRIEVGYGLEGALPDSVAAAIIADMVPYLRDANYDEALTVGARSIMAATEGEYQGSGGGGGNSFDPESFFTLFFFGIVLIQWFVAILSRSKSYWAGGVVGAVAAGVIATVFGWWLVGGLALLAVMTVLGLLLDYGVSHAYSQAKSSGVTPPWWTGGSGGGGSSSGGFGGFGGGSSGGGGASGSY